MKAENLYVHFPFCRRKCAYCSLFSRVGVEASVRNGYVRRLAANPVVNGHYSTVYFGGGSPALCDLRPLLRRLHADEFTVELHPLDVTETLLKTLADGGVNRISMGVQSLDDGILEAMGRGYTVRLAEERFALVRRYFENAGIDLIVGYPGESTDVVGGFGRLGDWGLRHCSVYALQNERGLKGVADDDTVLDRIRATARRLGSLGLKRYEVSNYAVEGFECRHNLAVWRGEDYIGLGDGACGRLGLERTMNFGGNTPKSEFVTPDFDERERRFFRLRTREGLDAAGHPEWLRPLNEFAAQGLLRRSGDVFVATARGWEVCDSILSALIS